MANLTITSSESQWHDGKDRLEVQILVALDEPSDDIPDSPEFWEGIRKEARELLARDNPE